MDDKKTILARMYYDELLKERPDLNKINKYEGQILNDDSFGDVQITKNDNTIVINHVFVLSKKLPSLVYNFPTNYAVEKAKSLRNKEMKKERNIYRKAHSEETLLNKLTNIENTHDLLYEKFLKDCPDKEAVTKIKSIMGDVYSMMAFYYLPNENEMPKFNALLERAAKRDITINNLEFCELVDDEKRQEAANKTLKEKKKLAISEMLNFKANTVGVDTINEYIKDENITSGRCLDATVEKDYAIALFKSEIEDLKDIPNEVKSLLVSDNSEIQIQLINIPYRTVFFSCTSAEYYWKVSWRDHNDNWYGQEGTYTYGSQNNVGMLDGCSNEYIHTSFIDTCDFRKRPFKEINENTVDNYLMPSNKAPSIPENVYVYDFKARESLIKELKAKDIYNERGIGFDFKFKCVEKPSYKYNVEELIYFPVYYVMIKNGNYLVRGYVDASSSGNVTILELIELNNEDDFNICFSKIREKEEYQVEQLKKEKIKQNKSVGLMVIMFITMLTSLLAFILDFSGFRAILYLIPAIISIFLPKSFKTNTTKIIVTIIMIISLILSISFLFLGVIA